jgi:HAD superfamily hydrolase (TIGR01509 family)
MIRALIFDMDGLMIDTERMYWEVGRSIAREYGKTVSDDTLRKMMGRERLASCRIYVEETGVPISAEDVLAKRERMMLDRMRGGVEPMPGLIELLKRFDGRLKMGVATSSPRVLVEAALPAIGVQRFFEVITAGDQVTHGKPDPEIYLTTIRKLGVTPRESIVLEDAPAGAEAGKRSGAYVIAVPGELTAQLDFSRVSDVRVRDLFEAAEKVEQTLVGRAAP